MDTQRLAALRERIETRHDSTQDGLDLLAEIDRLHRLLDRAYPWLHCPYTPQGSVGEWAQFQALIGEVQHAIAHLKEEDDPLVALPCASCDGTGCENCAPINPCGLDDGSTVCVLPKGHPIPHQSADGRRFLYPEG